MKNWARQEVPTCALISASGNLFGHPHITHICSFVLNYNKPFTLANKPFTLLYTLYNNTFVLLYNFTTNLLLCYITQYNNTFVLLYYFTTNLLLCDITQYNTFVLLYYFTTNLLLCYITLYNNAFVLLYYFTTNLLLRCCLQVLDSELYEIDQLLKGDRGRQCQVPSWCCNPCFSKVFKHPSDCFLPDYQLHDIKEASSETESDPRLAAPSPLIFDLSSSISDLDYSEDESDDSMNSVTESLRTESSGGASSISAGGGASSISAGTVNLEQDSLKKECNEQELEDDSGIDQDSGDQDSDEQQDSHYV